MVRHSSRSKLCDVLCNFTIQRYLLDLALVKAHEVVHLQALWVLQLHEWACVLDNK